MSKYDNASLVQIPSGYKASTLYSVLPANGNGDFTHTRGSSATRVNENGLIESVGSNVPRLNYELLNGVVQDCPALLLEPSRTNKITYSDNLSSGTTGSTITTNTTISPTGEINASTINASTNYIAKPFSGTSGNNTFSCFLKPIADYEMALYLYDGAYYKVTFNIEDGYVVSESSSTGSIEKYPNGWYRCIITANCTSAPSEAGVESINSATYTFGWQNEAGSYATSYIPTSGTTVTRAADTCNSAGTSAEFNDSEGVLFAEISRFDTSGITSYSTIGMTDGTNDNQVVFKFRNYQDIFYATVKSSNGTTRVDLNYTFNDVSQYTKVAVKYKTDDFSLWVNGFEVVTATGANSPVGLNDLAFSTQTGSEAFEGNTKQLATFNVALSDTQLEDLTSWDSFNEMATAQGYSLS